MGSEGSYVPTLLCIEDEAFLLEEIAGELRDNGFDVLEAADGDQGLELILAEKPDLVLCDVAMPRMDGRELVARLRNEHPHLADTPFIFLSAYADRTHMLDGLHVGADDYLTKPIDFDVLLSKIRTSLRQVQRMKARSDRLLADAVCHDHVTGLPNRKGFQEEASKFLRACSSRDLSCALFILDIVDFAEINDYYGADVGDQVLRDVAAALKVHAPQSSLVARLGNDEFAVLILEGAFEHSRRGEGTTIPEKITVAASGARRNIDVSLRAGLARYPRDGVDLKDLTTRADLALNSAKPSAKPSIVEFHHTMGEIFENRFQLVSKFRDALVASQIVPYYQPLIEIETGRVTRLEALARWRHPEGGLLSAGVFLDALQDRENAEMLGKEMIRQITCDVGGWKAAGVAFGSVGLNVSEADLLRPSFGLDIVKELARQGLSPDALFIEVTENVTFGSNRRCLLQKLSELRTNGFQIALDDFGTGYSSVTQIKELPCSLLKIDKSFIDNVVNNDVDRAIVRALAELGGKVGFELVAEGVETIEQCAVVRALGCRFVQGYLFSGPVEAADVPALIERFDRAQALDLAV